MPSQKRQNDLCSFPRQTIQYHSNPSLFPINAEEAEVEWFYEDLQDLLELTPPKKDVLFIIGDWNAKTPSSNNTREDSTHGHHQMVNTEIRLIIFFAAKDGETLYSQQKQDWELTVAQIMKSLLPNSDLN